VKAISVRAPWWWFILHGGKDIENRDWATQFRGRILIHASRWWKQSEVEEDAMTARSLMWSPHNSCDREKLPPDTFDQLKAKCGYVVGSVDLVNCVASSDSPWFFGRFGLVLKNPRIFAKPFAWKGSLGLFETGLCEDNLP
jgi:hypothetical protein